MERTCLNALGGQERAIFRMYPLLKVGLFISKQDIAGQHPDKN
jgi:hypothetical protein